jgi:hypothetical protein
MTWAKRQPGWIDAAAVIRQGVTMAMTPWLARCRGDSQVGYDVCPLGVSRLGSPSQVSNRRRGTPARGRRVATVNRRVNVAGAPKIDPRC